MSISPPHPAVGSRAAGNPAVIFDAHIGVASLNVEPAVYANEIQRGGPVRTEEAVGVFGVGLGAGLGALAACAPAMLLAPLCAVLAATAGVGGAALGGVAGDVASDIGDTRKIFSRLEDTIELQKELRLRVIGQLRDAGYHAHDLGDASVRPAPVQDLPPLVIETKVQEIAAQGWGRDGFRVSLLCSIRVLPGDEFYRLDTGFSHGYAAPTIPISADPDRDRTMEYRYVSPTLPLGADTEQIGHAIRTAVSAGVADIAVRIAAEDLARFRPTNTTKQ